MRTLGCKQHNKSNTLLELQNGINHFINKILRVHLSDSVGSRALNNFMKNLLHLSALVSRACKYSQSVFPISLKI